MTNPANTAGPNGDGSKSLAKESKVGLATAFVIQIALTALIGWLGTLNVSTLPGWAVQAGTLAISTLIGAATAYLKANGPAAYGRRS